MMVESALWRISRFGTTIATTASSRMKIDRELRRLIGRRLMRVQLAADLSVLDFETGLKLSLSPNPSRYDKLDGWTLFRGDVAILALSNRRRLDTFIPSASFLSHPRRKPDRDARPHA